MSIQKAVADLGACDWLQLPTPPPALAPSTLSPSVAVNVDAASVAASDRSVHLCRLPNKSVPSPGSLVTDLVPSSFFIHLHHHGRRVFDPTLSGKSPAQWYASARVAGLSIEDLDGTRLDSSSPSAQACPG